MDFRVLKSNLEGLVGLFYIAVPKEEYRDKINFGPDEDERFKVLTFSEMKELETEGFEPGFQTVLVVGKRAGIPKIFIEQAKAHGFACMEIHFEELTRALNFLFPRGDKWQLNEPSSELKPEKEMEQFILDNIQLDAPDKLVEMLRVYLLTKKEFASYPDLKIDKFVVSSIYSNMMNKQGRSAAINNLYKGLILAGMQELELTATDDVSKDDLEDILVRARETGFVTLEMKDLMSTLRTIRRNERWIELFNKTELDEQDMLVPVKKFEKFVPAPLKPAGKPFSQKKREGNFKNSGRYKRYSGQIGTMKDHLVEKYGKIPEEITPQLVSEIAILFRTRQEPISTGKINANLKTLIQRQEEEMFESSGTTSDPVG